MLKGFRDFILRGNVVDLAVAVVIGAAFSALVQAFVKGLVEPIVRVVLGGSATSLGGTITINGQVIDFALIINAVISFLITAFVVYFIFVLPMNKYRALKAKDAGPSTAVVEAEQLVLLKEIRDLLAVSVDRRPGGP